MFTDERRRSVWEAIRQYDLKAFESIMSPLVLVLAVERAGLKLGAGVLNLPMLAWLALSCAMRPHLSFSQVLLHTFGKLLRLGRLPKPRGRKSPARRAKGAKRVSGSQGGRGKKRTRSRPVRRSKHDPRVEEPDTPVSEEAFALARKLMPPEYWVALFLILGELYEARHRPLLAWQGLRLLVLDGTTITLEHHKALGEYFGFARNQHGRKRGGKKTARGKNARGKASKSKASKSKASKSKASKGNPRPQARMVMLLLGRVRMPWRYELTPRSQGESTVAARLLGHIRANDLVLMDRGFFHFNLFRQINDANAFFAIRRVKRLRFKTIRRIGPRERIVQWAPTASRWKGATILLRVIEYQMKGFRKSAIITNFLDEKRLPREQFVGLSQSRTWVTEHDAGLYHQRWQIETAFREIKRVQEMHEGLRGRTPEAIQFEIAGHVLLHLLTRWLMTEAAVGQGLDPLRLSFKNALDEIRNVLDVLVVLPPRQQSILTNRLLQDIARHQVPFRPGRSYPRKNDGKTRRTGAGYKIQPSKLQTCKA